MIDMATGNQQLPRTHYPMGRIAVMGAGAVGCYTATSWRALDAM